KTTGHYSRQGRNAVCCAGGLACAAVGAACEKRAIPQWRYRSVHKHEALLQHVPGLCAELENLRFSLWHGGEAALCLGDPLAGALQLESLLPLCGLIALPKPFSGLAR